MVRLSRPLSRLKRMSTTLRVSDKTHRRIAGLAKATGKRLQDVVQEAIDTYEQDQFWRELNQGYAHLRADEKLWNEVVAERAIWDKTVRDGLDEPAGR